MESEYVMSYDANTQVQYTTSNNVNAESNNMLQQVLKEVREIKEGQKQLIGKLTEEVVILRNEVRQLKLLNHQEMTTNLLPPMPLKTLEELKQFDEKLRANDDVVVQLKYVLDKVGGDSTSTFVRAALKKTMTDEVTAQLSWRGTNAKPSIQEFSVATIMRNVCHSKFPKADDISINKTMQQHFIHATDRMKKRAFGNQH